MKFELKTENDKFSKSFKHIFRNVSILALIIILCDVSLKLGNISKIYQIDYNCMLLSVEKSKFNFKKLSRLSNLNSKQKIWDFCKEFSK